MYFGLEVISKQPVMACTSLVLCFCIFAAVLELET
jgi:hypothetical protein